LSSSVTFVEIPVVWKSRGPPRMCRGGADENGVRGREKETANCPTGASQSTRGRRDSRGDLDAPLELVPE
jgi:hypothetical protein